MKLLTFSDSELCARSGAALGGFTPPEPLESTPPYPPLTTIEGVGTHVCSMERAQCKLQRTPSSPTPLPTTGEGGAKTTTHTVLITYLSIKWAVSSEAFHPFMGRLTLVMGWFCFRAADDSP
ncbi:hypothetical protein J6590_023677 [Homalodisca vitripennis]|nr:hypothetical protein J6590_023677 [Homalodisca vitripennis]